MASKMLFRANEILESTHVPFWGKDAFQYFQSDILSEENPFPCILGVEGFKKDLLRFSFVTTPYNYQDIRNAASALREYIDTFKTIGRYTSFVLFFKPEHKERSMEEYETMFWDTLTFLHQIDQKKWPQDIPKRSKKIHYGNFAFTENLFLSYVIRLLILFRKSRKEQRIYDYISASVGL